MHMKRIDAHQHFWQYDATRHSWMNEEMKVLKRNFSTHDLEPLLKEHAFDGCIAVQASQTEEENTFLRSLATSSTIIKGIVGWVDLQSPEVSERLAYYQQFPIMKGFRHIIHDEADIDFMLRPAFLNGIQQLDSYGYSYDILVFHHHLDNTVKLLQRNPGQRFVIDHIAKPDIGNKEITNWKKKMAAVAAFPNVYCKVSGMVTETGSNPWKQEDFTPYLDAVTELFGTERLMFGSDWPVCILSASYANVFRIVNDYFSGFSKEEQDNFFGLNAIRFYQL